LEEAASIEGVRVLAGLLVHRLGVGEQLARLLQAGPLPHASTMWAKSVVDEAAPGFGGIYSGAVSEDDPRTLVESAEVLITAGVQFTDLNSGFFSQQLPRQRTVELGAESASVGAATFAPVGLGDALDVLGELVGQRAAVLAPIPSAQTAPAVAAGRPEAAPWTDASLTQSRLWAIVAGQLRTGDIVLADQGTSFYGVARHRLPSGATFIGQPLWASIGYTLPACLGAGLADAGLTGGERRCVLLIGDGAAQMTAGELSTIIKWGHPTLVVLVDNDGYTIERAIRGPEQPYNDIAPWDWEQLALAYGASPDRVASARTEDELAGALERAAAAPRGLSFVRAVLPRQDVPALLSDLARAAAAASRPA
jgi:TPP-dependent 2-oxoacid decarboxylase